MKILLGLGLVLIALTRGAVAEPMIDWNDNRIQWHDYASGIKEVSRTGKNALLVFYSDWCPTCHAYTRLFDDSEIVALSEQLVMIRVNAAQSPAIGRAFSDDGEYLPRTYALDGNGEILPEMTSGHPRFKRFFQPEQRQLLREFMHKVVDHGPNQLADVNRF